MSTLSISICVQRSVPEGQTDTECSPELRDRTLRYAREWPSFKTEIGDYLRAHRSSGREVAFYGGGCRSSSLINFAELTPEIDLIVDDQEEKQGLYMPGSRIQILPSDVLSERDPGICLLSVNAENEEKVLARHRAFTDRGGLFESVHPPSKSLPSFWGRFGEGSSE